MAKNLRKQIIWCDQNSEIIIIKIAITRIGAKTSANTNLSESFTKNKKRTSIKHLMKNNYLIAKPSGKNVKPFFSDKGVNSSKVTLVEKNVI